MSQQNKSQNAPSSSAEGRKAALLTYEKKPSETKKLARTASRPQKNKSIGARVRAGSPFLFSHTFTAPLLCAVVYILVIATSSIDLASLGATGTEVYLSLSAISLFVFMIPSVFYIRFRSLDMRDDLRLRLPSPDKIMFLVLCTLVLIFASVLTSAIDGSGGVYTQGYAMISSDGYDSAAPLYYAVCFAIIPAVCEELLFRSVIMSELQKSSLLSAVVISSLYFAMLHFDFAQFPFYFFAGTVLSACAYATNSAIASFAVHLGFNLFATFGGGMVEAVVKSIGDLKLITVIAAVMFLLSLTLALGECQRIYAAYARKNKDSSYLPEYKKGTGGMRFAQSLLSPMSLVCILIFTISTLLMKG